MTGKKLSVDDLIRLKFARNEQGEYVDPVTFKVFTNNSHIVAIKPTGNVFAYDTVERLNIKAKMWQDLVSDEEFTRKDLITLQDPHNLEGRNLSSFKYIKDGVSTLTPEQERDKSAGVNRSALGNAASVLRPPSAELLSKPQVGRYLAPSSSKTASTSTTNALTKAKAHSPTAKPEPKPSSSTPKAHHTTGLAAASLTSTGLTPHTSTTPATLSQETYLLTRAHIAFPGHLTLTTSHGPLTLQLLPQHAPRAVWNFITLSKRGYYNNVLFHRNIRNFMLQGGDPTGTGRGGESCWGKSKAFQDEWARSPLSHDKRGVLSMANKGRDTNTSQFFITYRACKHLDRKHTIFGNILGGDEASFATLSAIEALEVEEGSNNRPLEDVRIENANVFDDPFERFLRGEEEARERESAKREVEMNGGAEDEKVTWTGKRVGGVRDDEGVAVGKYMAPGDGRQLNVEEWEEAAEEPVKKKYKASGGFGDFDGW